MAIYLDEQTTVEIKRLLKKEIEAHPNNFIAPRLLKMVEADIERKQTIATCTHDWNEMTGHKTQCNKCYGIKDGFEEYTSNDFVRDGERTTHQSKDYGNTAPTIPTQSTN